MLFHKCAKIVVMEFFSVHHGKIFLCILAAFSQMQIGILEKTAHMKLTKWASMLD